MDNLFQILLVEDNPADVRLTKEALVDGKIIHQLHVVKDGLEAIAFLRGTAPFRQQTLPDLILLDLNLPKMDGRQVLEEIKMDQILRKIPVVILTSSEAEKDITKTYDLHANGYIVKPVDIDQFFEIIKKTQQFWMSVVQLPPNHNR